MSRSAAPESLIVFDGPPTHKASPASRPSQGLTQCGEPRISTDTGWSAAATAAAFSLALLVSAVAAMLVGAARTDG